MSQDIDHTKNVSHQCGFFMTFKITIACDQCDCKLKRKGDLKKHLESVHGDVWQTCDQCVYKAKQKGNLKQIQNLIKIQVPVASLTSKVSK